MDISVGTTAIRTHITEQEFINKMAQSLFSEVPVLFRQHCHEAAQQIAFEVIGPINEDSIASASALIEWKTKTGFAMFHESSTGMVDVSLSGVSYLAYIGPQLDFDGLDFRRILHLAFRVDPSSPTFMGVFQKVTRSDGSERFERIKKCTMFSISWLSSNVSFIIDRLF